MVTSTQPVSSNLPVSSNPVQTQDQLIEAAVGKLTETAVNNLWKENVTEAAWYAKIYGLFCYAWNRSTAVEQDRQFGATIDNFNKTSSDLVKKVFNRSLKPEEATKLGSPQVKFNDSSAQLKYNEFNTQADQALEAFYTLFKQRVTQLNINPNTNVAEFGVYAAAAQKIINDLSKSEELLSKSQFPHVVPTKIETTLNGFNQKIFKDMVDAYASLPLADITIESFKQRAALIKGFFESISETDIETQMRQAIKAKHPNSADFNTIRGEYMDPAATAPRFVATKGTIHGTLTAERTRLQAELDVLRGTDGHNGTIHTAYGEMVTAQNEMNAAYGPLEVAFRGIGGWNYGNQPAVIAMITAFLANPNANAPQGGVTVNQIQTLFATYNDKATVFATKQQAYNELDAKRVAIAQYQQGTTNIVGGKLATIDANLQGAALDNAARFETQRMADFYQELNQPVLDGFYKAARTAALQAIFNRQMP